MTASSPTVSVGPFVVGEKPDRLEYQFQDAVGAPIDLTGYAVKFVYRERDGAATEAAAALSATPTDGKVTYTWTGAESPTPGEYLAEFWVGNGAQRYTSWLITWRARAPVGPVPSV